MKTKRHIITIISAIMFLCSCQSYSGSSSDSLSSVFDNVSSISIEIGSETSSQNNSSDGTSTNSESPFNYLNSRLPAHYHEVIDPISNKEYNWKAPVSSSALIKPIDSYTSYFEEEKSYALLSIFDNIQLQYVTDYYTFEGRQYLVDLLHGIKISVRYRNVREENDIIWTRFQISEDGRFGFLTADQTVMFYTDSGVISYDGVKSKIEEMDDYYHKKNNQPNRFNKSSLSFKQNRNYYILTPNKSGIEVEYHGEALQSEIEQMNQEGDAFVQEAIRIADSSIAYNCHSYAWYLRSTSNDCWIGDPSYYYEDGTYEEIEGIGDVGDIICYFDSNNHNDHSGVIIAKTEGPSNNVCGNSDLVTVVSKWGPYGLYQHRGDECPYTYPYGGDATHVKYYRPHFNESISLSNPLLNTTQTIDRDNYVDELIYFGQTSNYVMFELNISYAKSYSFEISADYYLEVSLFKGPMQEVTLNQVSTCVNGVYKISFDYLGTLGNHYLRATYENSAYYGTIHTKITNTHSHNYSFAYSWYNYLQHYSLCTCFGSILSGHVVSQSSLNDGSLYKPCMLCGGDAYIGYVGPLALGNMPTSANGSYILPNGIIVLVDEDIDAYLNGTLVFLPPNSN